MNVFTYGTLCIPKVMTAVCGRLPASSPARLEKYRCRLIKGHNFPGIVPQAGDGVRGRLYVDVSPQELLSLDEFESDFYQRLPVPIWCEEKQVSASAYIVSNQNKHLLSDKPWDEQYFRDHHLATYL